MDVALTVGLEFVSCPHGTLFCLLVAFFSNADLGPTVPNLGFGRECLSGRTFALPAAANVAKPTIVILSCRINSCSGERWEKKKGGEKCFG